jgi:alpha-tubulin suppressor-like RCC1 family protein
MKMPINNLKFLTTTKTKTTNKILTWGCNINYALGRPPYGEANVENPSPIIYSTDNNDPVTQISCGWGHTSFITQSCKCYVVGRAIDRRNTLTFGRLASTKPSLANFWMKYLGGYRSVDFLEPTLISNDTIHVKCSAGWTLGLSRDGIPWAFGHNLKQQTGTGLTSKNVFNPEPVLTPPSERIMKIAAGYQHGLALSENGHVYFWGTWSRDEKDHLSVSKPSRVDIGYASDISCGFSNCAVVTQDGQLYVWGKEQGIDLLSNGRLNDAIQPRLVQLPNSEKVNKVWCGQFHVICQTTRNNNVYLASGNVISRRQQQQQQQSLPTNSIRIMQPVLLLQNISNTTKINVGFTSAYVLQPPNNQVFDIPLESGSLPRLTINPILQNYQHVLQIDEGWRHNAAIVRFVS